MQVIRLHYPKAPRSMAQKIKEILLAVRYDLFHSKKEILFDFATHAPFGGNVVGLETASWRYFNKSPYSLTWSESATLAVLPNAPGLIHPGKNRDALISKRNRLLDKLLTAKVLDSTEYKLSIAEPLIPRPSRLTNSAPHLLERVKQASGHRFYSLSLIHI